MEHLPPLYLAEIARQMAFVSAFLGGFSATFLGTLLYSNASNKISNWMIVSTSLSACAFIVAVSALTGLTIVHHPDIPQGIIHPGSITKGRIVGFLSFILGTYALLCSLGLSGWLRSKKIGIATSIIAGISFLLISWLIIGF